LEKRYDVVIKNGKIVDGTGNPWFKADVGIKQGKVDKIGIIESEEALKTVIAEGMVVSPGFIDIHNHTDLTMFGFPYCESFVMQGITTGVMGNCGSSLAPVNSKSLNLLKNYLSPLMAKVNFDWNWNSFEEYLGVVREKKVAINLVPLVGHGAIRSAVKGFDKSESSQGEIEEMKKLLADSLLGGAFGMSTGLYYPPGGYANTKEIIELGKILKQYGGIYATHIRDEATRLIESVKEAIRIGEENDIPVEISHHKAMCEENWGKINHTLSLMEDARKRGVEVGCDVYPYEAGSGNITSILPLWTMENGSDGLLKRLTDSTTRKQIKEEMIYNIERGDKAGLDKIIIASCPANRGYEGKYLHEIIKEKINSNEFFEGFFDILLETKTDASIIVFFMNEEDIKTIISNPLSAICSDAWPTSPVAGGNPHPRAYGTFPRVLGKYVREEKILSLEEAVRKMTSLPASRVRLKDRGLIKVGFWADIVIFDSERINDESTFQNPHQYAVGIANVLINGGFAVENGKLTYNSFGDVLSPNR
jgi:N-acyl-D-amino-acid deacylase